MLSEGASRRGGRARWEPGSFPRRIWDVIPVTSALLFSWVLCYLLPDSGELTRYPPELLFTAGCLARDQLTHQGRLELFLFY